MAKRVFIIHSWGGHPEEGWIPSLSRALEADGFSVSAPAMPDTDHPKIEAWVSHLSASVGDPDRETVLVGHSIGCQTILRYLASLPPGSEIAGAVLVAGWFILTPKGAPTREEIAIVRPWIKTPMDYERIHGACPRIVAIFSDNDPFVPLENADFFRDRLGAEVMLESGKGHFSEGDGITELPRALEAVRMVAGAAAEL